MGKLYRRENSPYWWARWQDGGGATHRESTRSADRRVATLYLSAREAEVIREGAGIPVARRIALADAVGAYLAEHKPPVWADAWWYGVNRWWHSRLIDDLGGAETLVSSVTREHVATLPQRWLAGGDEASPVKPPTVNRLLAVGSGFYRWAMERGMALTNPFAGQKRFAEQRADPPLVSEAVLDALLAAIDHPLLRRAATVSADTGLRKSELERAAIEDVAGNALAVVSGYERGHTKTKAPRLVPLTPRAAQALREQIGKRESGAIFGPLPDYRFHLARACASVKLRRLRWHDIRHVALTRAANAGALGHDLKRLAGWKSLAMADRYVHPDDERVKAVIARLGQCAPAVQAPRTKTRKDKHRKRTRSEVSPRDH